ncbi:hypothetical protein GCM10010411_34740 [Actinomadura fulvescens]|uniref:Uncharacterized protein n=1 Tax=Actinomadura fulvescens TaxID=46160 RepID=A0ABN3PQY0_9ACTN
MEGFETMYSLKITVVTSGGGHADLVVHDVVGEAPEHSRSRGRPELRLGQVSYGLLA